tara:strand:- start:637 stop:2871 length:2235 start_codon:yes stop_codon:yes gene_type:complete
MQKIIVTLGPATNSLDKVAMIKSKGVDFVRVNMSHSSLEDLKHFVTLSKKVGAEFIIDTEGSQIRTGYLKSNKLFFSENDEICLYDDLIDGDNNKISLRPKGIIAQLKLGDILYVDFDTLVMCITNIKNLKNGFVHSTVISSGYLGENKSVVIDSKFPRKFNISTLTQKDISAINLGINEGIKYVSASFIRSGDGVKEIKKYSKNKMKIISKIECKDALKHIDEIIHESDYLLIDRGDLSKEIPVIRIPLVQKVILQKANHAGIGVFVATNLLESMILNRKPTRAEVHDIFATIIDGAYGLVLAAETAIGNYPIGCINMLNKIIKNTNNLISEIKLNKLSNKFLRDSDNYLLDDESSYSIIAPHGGELINRFVNNDSDLQYDSVDKIKLNVNQLQDVYQIATGAFSPLKGFINQLELVSILDRMELPNGLCWPIPILLDVDSNKSDKINIGDIVELISPNNNPIGYINVNDKFSFSKKLIAKKLYGTDDPNHPGVKYIMKLKSLFLGGEINVFDIEDDELIEYSITPKQSRRLFEEKNWSKVIGFHTRNVIHRAHEFIQLTALKRSKCDGMFLHPVVGNKKPGDYNPKYIVKSYDIMKKDIYPEEKIVFGVFSTYSRYAGTKEAIFTAICRKNFGCSHFIIGRDHTGVGDLFESNIQQNILSSISDLGIEIVNFNTVYYSKKNKSYVEGTSNNNSSNNDLISINGSDIRMMFNENKMPPELYMRPEISKMILESIKANEPVFVK